MDKFKKQAKRIFRKIRPRIKFTQNHKLVEVGDLTTFVCSGRHFSKMRLTALICDISDITYTVLIKGEIHTIAKDFYDVVQNVKPGRDLYNNDKGK